MRHIGREDIEFYEPAQMLKIAQAMARRHHPSLDWGGATAEFRRRWCQRALDVLELVLNDPNYVESIYRFSSLKMKELRDASWFTVQTGDEVQDTNRPGNVG